MSITFHRLQTFLSNLSDYARDKIVDRHGKFVDFIEPDGMYTLGNGDLNSNKQKNFVCDSKMP